MSYCPFSLTACTCAKNGRVKNVCPSEHPLKWARIPGTIKTQKNTAERIQALKLCGVTKQSPLYHTYTKTKMLKGHETWANALQLEAEVQQLKATLQKTEQKFEKEIKSKQLHHYEIRKLEKEKKELEKWKVTYARQSLLKEQNDNLRNELGLIKDPNIQLMDSTLGLEGNLGLSLIDKNNDRDESIGDIKVQRK
eukprot:Awhi_evm1s13957